MSDYERYGDYNDIEDDAPKSKNPVIIILKIFIAIVCISVIGIIVFRMILFSTYPKEVGNIYFNDALTAYYNENGGEIGAKTQDLRAPYDDPDKGNFFCDKLIVIEELGQLQITVRYNTGNLIRMAEELSIPALDPDSSDLFSYRICINYGNGGGEDEYYHVYNDNVTAEVFASRVMYRYEKIVFDGIEFSADENGYHPEWIRLEVFVNGVESAEPYAKIPIYENNSAFSDFKDYELSRKEKP